jgi:hypothetical protein
MSQRNGTLNRAAHPCNGHAPPSSTPSSTDGRNATGQFTEGNHCGVRFQPGNHAGRGNRYYRQRAELCQAVAEAVGSEGVREIMTKLFDLARGGHIEAARLFLEYSVGKPPPAADPDRCDLNEFEILAANPTRGDITTVLSMGVPAACAVQVLQDVFERDLRKKGK